MTPTKEQKTQKQVIGKTLVELNVMGLASNQWRIRLSGIITGANRTELATNRASVEALNSAGTHTYTDGIHDGTYYVVPGSITFTDSQSDAGSIYHYTMEVVQQ